MCSSTPSPPAHTAPTSEAEQVEEEEEPHHCHHHHRPAAWLLLFFLRNNHQFWVGYRDLTCISSSRQRACRSAKARQSTMSATNAQPQTGQPNSFGDQATCAAFAGFSTSDGDCSIQYPRRVATRGPRSGSLNNFGNVSPLRGSRIPGSTVIICAGRDSPVHARG